MTHMANVWFNNSRAIAALSLSLSLAVCTQLLCTRALAPQNTFTQAAQIASFKHCTEHELTSKSNGWKSQTNENGSHDTNQQQNQNKNAMTMMTALTISDDKPIEWTFKMSPALHKWNFHPIFSLVFFAAFCLCCGAISLYAFFFVNFLSETSDEMKKADNQMNTIGKTPEEQFLFPQSKSALEERETEKSKRTKLFALFLQQQQRKNHTAKRRRRGKNRNGVSIRLAGCSWSWVVCLPPSDSIHSNRALCICPFRPCAFTLLSVHFLFENCVTLG